MKTTTIEAVREASQLVADALKLGLRLGRRIRWHGHAGEIESFERVDGRFFVMVRCDDGALRQFEQIARHALTLVR